MQARFELADLLEKSGLKTQHRGATSGFGRLAQSQHQGEDRQLLLNYGGLAKLRTFQDVVRTDDRMPGLAGLGQAELALENYQEARDAFQKRWIGIHRCTQ